MMNDTPDLYCLECRRVLPTIMVGIGIKCRQCNNVIMYRDAKVKGQVPLFFDLGDWRCKRTLKTIGIFSVKPVDWRHPSRPAYHLVDMDNWIFYRTFCAIVMDYEAIWLGQMIKNGLVEVKEGGGVDGRAMQFRLTPDGWKKFFEVMTLAERDELDKMDQQRLDEKKKLLEWI